MRKFGLNIFVRVFLIESSCLNYFKVDRIQDIEEKIGFYFFIFFHRKIHKQFGRLEALQLADAQSTGLWRCGRRWKSPLDGAVSL